MPHFAKGAIHFQHEVFPHWKALFERLILGQSPEALFITCSNSRIETAMITPTDPYAADLAKLVGDRGCTA